MSMSKFTEYLLREMQEREWGNNELARRIEIKLNL
jgi:hypothetical protein